MLNDLIDAPENRRNCAKLLEDGKSLTLTRAYDIYTEGHTGNETSQAMLIPGNNNMSQFNTCLEVANNRIKANDISTVLNTVRACTLCTDLALGPKPILQLNPTAKILIAGQAPGRKTHHKGIPFDDPSGDRLRDWMGIDPDTFYNESAIAILPMAFCYPGTGKSGDLPPPAQCAEQWREQLLNLLPNIELTLVIGQYALDWHLGNGQARTLTETVRQWQDYWPQLLPMPHPSPRNNRWLKNNPWFSSDILPKLKSQVASLLK